MTFDASLLHLVVYFLQTAVQPLKDGADLRDGVQVALATFKDSCCLGPIANLKQCIRLLSSRIANSGELVSLSYSMQGEVSETY